MKNKIAVMFLTLIIMILITPFVFNKLMNSRFNTMLLTTQQQRGIIIKEKENKSSYLTTNRVFEITIPGKAIGIKDIKYIKLLTSVEFKNLPVTNVIFHNVVKKFVLSNGEDVKFLENNLIFDVITPDFKHYKYKVVDKKVKEDGVEISWNGFKGICIYPNKCENEDGNLTLKDKKAKISLIGIKSQFLVEKNRVEQILHLKEFLINAPNLLVDVKNINSKNIKIDKKNKIDAISEIKVSNVNINNLIKLSKIYFKIALNDINKKVLNTLNEKERVKVLLDSGFNGDIKLSIKDIFFIQPLGFLNADVNFSVIKGNNFEKLQKNKEIDFINLDAKIEASDKMLVFLNKNPKISSYIKLQNHKAIIEIKIKKGKIFINGKEIKSN